MNTPDQVCQKNDQYISLAAIEPMEKIVWSPHIEICMLRCVAASAPAQRSGQKLDKKIHYEAAPVRTRFPGGIIWNGTICQRDSEQDL